MLKNLNFGEKKLRILIIFELGPLKDFSYMGGIENHIMQLGYGLASLGHKVTFLTGAIPNTPKYQTISNNFHVMRTDLFKLVEKKWNFANLKFSRQLFFLLTGLLLGIKIRRFRGKNKKWDIIHGHVYSAGLLANYLARMTGAISVNTIHGSYYDHWYQIADSKMSALMFKSMERILAPILTKISDYQIHTDYHFAKKVAQWAHYPNNVGTIHNAVDPNIFSPEVKPSEDILKLKRDQELIIVSIRRLVKKNGLNFLIEAIPRVLKKQKALFVIIGDGPEKSNLEKQARNLGIKNILFLGNRPNKEIPGILKAIDISVLPSIVEASSIGVLEGIAMKKPVVATAIPGIKEIVNKDLVKLVQSENPESLATGILEVINDQNISKTTEKAYQHFIKSYTTQINYNKHLKLYYNLLNKNNKRQFKRQD